MATTTWCKLKSGEWGAKVEGGGAPTAGAVLTITRKNGETSQRAVARVVWSGGGTHLCALAPEGGTVPRAPRTGDRPAPGKRSCDYCGSRACARAWDPHMLCDED